MGRKQKNSDFFENVIMSHPVQILHWIGKWDNCIPCKEQDKTLRGIVNEVGSPVVGMETLERSKYMREFGKYGNKVLPSINVFVNGKPMFFVDTKLSAGKKPKPLKSLSGNRDKTTLINVIYESLDKL